MRQNQTAKMSEFSTRYLKLEYDNFSYGKVPQVQRSETICQYFSPLYNTDVYCTTAMAMTHKNDNLLENEKHFSHHFAFYIFVKYGKVSIPCKENNSLALYKKNFSNKEFCRVLGKQ